MTRVVAHLIVGAKPEPFLGAMLASIEPAVERIVVNENSGMGERAPNLTTLQNSDAARAGKLAVVRTEFESFASARNACFAADAGATPETWVAFIDADEVHFERFARIVRRLRDVPPEVDFVDGYTWHFYFSFDWYAAVERRMMLHRWRPGVRWEGVVHERLAGLDGARIALPYVYAHYGNVMSFAEHARKGAQYAGLGQEGTPLEAAAAAAAEERGDFSGVERYYAGLWPKLLRYNGEHPSQAQPVIDALRAQKAEQYAAIDRIVRAHQPPARRLANALMKLNYEQRWRARAFNPLARRLAE